MEERRKFSRLAVALSGRITSGSLGIPIVINNFDVPIEIDDISEIGIGFLIKTEDIPANIQISEGDILNIEFVDEDFEDGDILQKCSFKVVQCKERMKKTFIGGVMDGNDYDYPKYVQSKKKQRLELDAQNLDDFLSGLLED